MENKPLEIKTGTWSYDKFFDGKIMEEMDNARKNSHEPIPDKPHHGDLYWSKTKNCFYRHDGEVWINTLSPNDKYTNFGMKLLYKKDNGHTDNH